MEERNLEVLKLKLSSENGKEVEEALYDIISLVESNHLTIQQFITTIKEKKYSEQAKRFPEEFMDSLISTLWIRSLQVSDVNRKQLVYLIKDLQVNNIVQSNDLKLSLELPILAELSTTNASAATANNAGDVLHKRLIKVNTGIVYKQQKFNLLREETEGYAKLVTVLNNIPYGGDVDEYVKNILSIIGFFELEPNRVVDIILDVFEQHPNNTNYLNIIEELKLSNIVHVLGFKYAHYEAPQLTPSNTTDKLPISWSSTNKVPAPKSLFTLTAKLISRRLVEMHEVLAYLSPSIHATKQQLLKNKVNKKESLVVARGKVTTWSQAPIGEELKTVNNDNSNTSSNSSSNAKPPPPAYPPPMSVLMQHQPGSAGSAKGEKPSTTSKSNEIVQASVPAVIEVTEANNQVICLISALIENNDWQHAKLLIWELLTAEDESVTSATTASATVESKESSKLQVCDLIDFSPQVRAATNKLLSRTASQLLEGVRGSRVKALGKNSGTKFTAQQSLFKANFDGIDGYTVPPLVDVDEKLLAVLSLAVKTATDSSQPSMVNERALAAELIQLLEYRMGEDALTFQSSVRLLKAIVVKYNSSSTAAVVVADCVSDKQSFFSTVSEYLIIPLLHAVTISRSNSTYYSCLLYQGLYLVPFEYRFACYELWKQNNNKVKSKLLGKTADRVNNNIAAVVAAENSALASARHDLKRLAKENTKQIGKNLSKAIHASPITVMTLILNQIEVFDNLIPYVVDALRFSSFLCKDTFAYCFLNKLSAEQGPDKVQNFHYAHWFIALSKFIAAFYHKYPNTETQSLLHHLLHSFSSTKQQGNSSNVSNCADLLVLKDLLNTVGGTSTLLEVSHSQLEGLSGGKTIKHEIMHSTLMLSNNSSMKSSVSQTKKAALLLRENMIASKTALPLLLYIAKIRSNILFEQSDAPLKLLSSIFDVSQDILMQFTEFLSSDDKTLESMSKSMPAFADLVGDINISVEVAFQLVRPIIRLSLSQQAVGSDNNSNNSSTHQSTLDTDISNIDNNKEKDGQNYLQRFHPFNNDEILRTIQSKLSTITTIEDSVIVPALFSKLYVLFWSLSLYDISAPVETYQQEIKRIKDRYAELDQKKFSVMTSVNNSASSELQKLNKQRDSDMKQMMTVMAALSEEMLAQKKHTEQVRDMVRSFKQELLVPDQTTSTTSDCTTSTAVMSFYMQELVLKRLLMSPIDALYCVKFSKLLHELDLHGFSLLSFLDKMLRSIASLVYCSTENEAAFIGFALQEVLHSYVNRWNDSKQLFQLECLRINNSKEKDKGKGHEGDNKEALIEQYVQLFSRVFGDIKLGFDSDDNTTTVDTASMEVVNTEDPNAAVLRSLREELSKSSDMTYTIVNIAHQHFNQLATRWSNALSNLLLHILRNESEYMYIRCALILLSKVIVSFPTKKSIGNEFNTVVTDLMAREEKAQRNDLMMMARSLLVLLKNHGASWENDLPMPVSVPVPVIAKPGPTASVATAEISKIKSEASVTSQDKRGSTSKSNTNNINSNSNSGLKEREHIRNSVREHISKDSKDGNRDVRDRGRDKDNRDRERDSKDMKGRDNKEKEKDIKVVVDQRDKDKDRERDREREKGKEKEKDNEKTINREKRPAISNSVEEEKSVAGSKRKLDASDAVSTGNNNGHRDREAEVSRDKDAVSSTTNRAKRDRSNSAPRTKVVKDSKVSSSVITGDKDKDKVEIPPSKVPRKDHSSTNTTTATSIGVGDTVEQGRDRDRDRDVAPPSNSTNNSAAGSNKNKPPIAPILPSQDNHRSANNRAPPIPNNAGNIAYNTNPRSHASSTSTTSVRDNSRDNTRDTARDSNRTYNSGGGYDHRGRDNNVGNNMSHPPHTAHYSNSHSNQYPPPQQFYPANPPMPPFYNNNNSSNNNNANHGSNNNNNKRQRR